MATVKVNSKKKAENTAKNTSAKKATTPKKEKVEASSKNTQANVEAKSLTRDVKYLYPQEMTDKADRKKFRTSARAKFRSFEKKMAKATPKEQKAIQKELNAFLKETFVDGVKATIGR